jgi:hypothetical protein
MKKPLRIIGWFYLCLKGEVKMSLFNLFKKKSVEFKLISCQSCCHYGCVKTEDILNPDKTVTRGELQYEWCNKGKFYLNDHKQCELYEEGNRSAKIMPPPIMPPRGGTGKSC